MPYKPTDHSCPYFWANPLFFLSWKNGTALCTRKKDLRHGRDFFFLTWQPSNIGKHIVLVSDEPSLELSQFHVVTYYYYIMQSLSVGSVQQYLGATGGCIVAHDVSDYHLTTIIFVFLQYPSDVLMHSSCYCIVTLRPTTGIPVCLRDIDVLSV
jgi:hypothetical protein